MHIWPSLKIRESFKVDYLNRVEWNLRRMKSEKQSPASQKLLNDQGDAVNGKVIEPQSTTDSKLIVGIRDLFGDILMILSCCFCCGACVDEEEDFPIL